MSPIVQRAEENIDGSSALLNMVEVEKIDVQPGAQSDDGSNDAVHPQKDTTGLRARRK